MIKHIIGADEKKSVARSILAALPDWFGIPESTEKYIAECADPDFFAAFGDAGRADGFISLKYTGRDTAEIAVMGVLPGLHRRGIGKKLFAAARECARQRGCSFLQVKTVRQGLYPNYDDTNRFYRAVGFKEFEVFPTLWGEQNLCQVYVMSLR